MGEPWKLQRDELEHYSSEEINQESEKLTQFILESHESDAFDIYTFLDLCESVLWRIDMLFETLQDEELRNPIRRIGMNKDGIAEKKTKALINAFAN
jgi:hypothetical protein